MARRSDFEMLMEDLARLPWWASVVVAVVVYVAVGEVLPRVAGESALLGPFVDMVSKLAGLIAALFLIPGAVSAFRGIRDRRMLAASPDGDGLRALDWRRFEELMAAYYQREGYDVAREGGDGPDGGVDLRLRRRGETRLVQCKQWRTRRVGVKTVRELYGVVSAERATGGIVVTTGSYTAEAERFAADVAIDLVDGARLVGMIGSAAGTGRRGGGDAARDEVLANADVVEMARAGVADAVIVAKIRSSATGFDVGVPALIDLGKAGVSDAVVAAMVECGRGGR